MAYGSNIKWTEISRTNEGIQYLDKDSTEIKGEGIVKIATKYLKINPNTLEEIEENNYVTEINCLTNQLKDISINSKKNSTAKWEIANGDKLLNDLILDACKNV